MKKSNLPSTTAVTQMSANDIQKEKIRALVNGIYDIQKLRIAAGNRIASSFNIQMGQAPSTKQEDMDKEAKKLIDKLKEEYKLITDAYIGKTLIKTKSGSIISSDGKTDSVRVDSNSEKKPKTDVLKTATVIQIKPNDSVEKIIQKINSHKDGELLEIKDKTDYELVKSYMELCDSEELQIKCLDKIVKAHPTWDKFFSGVKGCGPLMAGVCIAYFDVHKARHASSFWKYAGLDVVPIRTEYGPNGELRILEGEGRGKKHAKGNTVNYKAKDGTIKQKDSLGYNPILKSKLCGVLADCILKAGLRTIKDENGNPVVDENGNKVYVVPTEKENKYVNLYINYLNRLNQRTNIQNPSTIHKVNMAKRYMIKMFVQDLWVDWREIEGYEPTLPYREAMLHQKPHHCPASEYRKTEDVNND